MSPVSSLKYFGCIFLFYILLNHKMILLLFLLLDCCWFMQSMFLKSFPSPPWKCLESESESEVAQSCPTLCDRWTLSMGCPRQGYWSGLPFPSPGENALLHSYSLKIYDSYKIHGCELLLARDNLLYLASFLCVCEVYFLSNFSCFASNNFIFCRKMFLFGLKYWFHYDVFENNLWIYPIWVLMFS